MGALGGTVAEAGMSTGEVARKLGVTERRIQDVLRARPDLAPPVTAGKRRWSPAHVRALKARLDELSGRKTAE